ncbi:hypothetical protein C8J56DRAFT_1046258 [Mycena floridula]|nr:hypothetical protein C8J56DRAFT_1046258 [Mycena floridula]
MNIWWERPCFDDFKRELSNTGIGLGYWRTSYLSCFLVPFVDDLRARYHAYFDAHSQTSNSRIVLLKKGLELIAERLTALPMTFRQCCVQLMLFQHVFLELTAALDWCEKWQPIFNGLLPAPSTIAHVMGCFTNDDAVVQVMFKAAIPLIGPSNSIPLIVTEEASPPFNVFFTSSATDERKHSTIQKYFGSFLHDQDVFDDWKTHSNHPLNAHSHRGHHQPYTKKPTATKTKVQQSQHSPFEEPVDPCVPLTPAIWTISVAQIDRNGNDPQRQSIGHIFPHPTIFVGLQSIEKKTNYLCNWLLFHFALIAHVASGTYSVINADMWLGLIHGPSAKKQTGNELIDDDFDEILASIVSHNEAAVARAFSNSTAYSRALHTRWGSASLRCQVHELANSMNYILSNGPVHITVSSYDSDDDSDYDDMPPLTDTDDLTDSGYGSD